MQTVITTARPFGLDRHVEMPLGMSVADICKRLHGSLTGVIAFIRCPEGSRQLWEVVPDHMWSLVKPKGKNCLRFEFYPAGGKSSNLFAIAAAVIVSVAAPYLAGAVLGTTAAAAAAAGGLTALTFAGTSAAIAIGGNLLVSKLFAPETQGIGKQSGEQAAAEFSNTDADANVLGQGVPPPKVHGLRRVTLPDLMYPHRYLENGVDVIEKVIGASGYHSLTEIQVNKVDIDNVPGAEYQVRDGQESAAQQTLIKRVTKTKSIGEEFTKFLTVSGSQNLIDQIEPANSEPQPIVFSPGYHPDMEQITARINLDPFLFQADQNVTIAIPMRITLTDKAGVVDPINLPEIVIIGKKSSAVPKEIRIRRDDNFGFVAASSDYNYAFYQRVPATASTLSDGSSGDQWQAHSSFATGSGIRDTKNINGTLDSINVKLSPGDIPWADYEVSVVVGCPVPATLFDQSTYATSGVIQSLFKSRLSAGSWIIPYPSDGVFAGISLLFSVLVVKRYPVEIPGIAQIAMRFRGSSAKAVTCLAGLYVNDWDTDAWDNLIVTKNPAPHYRHVLRDAQKFSRVSYDLNSDDEFLAWRTECAARGYEVNFVSAGQAVNEVLGHIATAGFATKRFGTGYGIEFHRNRHDPELPDEERLPVMTFSHRDSKISIERVFGDSPKGYLVEFDDEDKDWANDGPIRVNNPWGSASLEANETRSYPSISNRQLVIQRTEFDALQEAYRNKVYKIDTGPAGFHRKRGDMIGVVTDLDSEYAHGFYVRQVLDERTVALDRSVPVEAGEYITDLDDITIEEDILAAGANSTVHMVTPGGVEVYTLAEVSGNVIQFTSEIPESWTVGDTTYLRSSLQGTRLTVAANMDLFKRLLVTDVKRAGNQRAIVYAVEEMPIIETTLRKKYA